MKKVLTVFLSIALVLAMMPAMAFANDNAEDTKLYCFNRVYLKILKQVN